MSEKRQLTLRDSLLQFRPKLLTRRVANGSPLKKIRCPVCGCCISSCLVNDHLDRCLKFQERQGRNDLVLSSKTGLPNCKEVLVELKRNQDKITEEKSVGMKEETPVEKGADCALVFTTETPLELKVFLWTLNFALEQYDYLFSSEEKNIVNQVLGFSARLQNLLVKILNKKGKQWHTSRKFEKLKFLDEAYSELDFIELEKFGLLERKRVSCDVSNSDLNSFLVLLTNEQLKTACRQLDLKTTDHKTKLIGLLSSSLYHISGAQKKLDGQSSNSVCWNYIAAELGTLIRIPSVIRTLFDRIHRICCLHSTPDTSLILQHFLGRLKFPRYQCLYTRRVFTSRNCFLEFIDACKQEEIFDDALCHQDEETVDNISSNAEKLLIMYRNVPTDRNQRGDIPNSLPSLEQMEHPTFKTFSGLWFFGTSKAFERCVKRLLLLLHFSNICSHRRGKYWYRLSIDFIKSGGTVSETLRFCLQALEDHSVVNGERVEIARRASRLICSSRREKLSGISPSEYRRLRELIEESQRQYVPLQYKNIPEDIITGRPVEWSRNKSSRNLFFGYNEQLISVEALCLEHYSLQGWSGVHCEGRLMSTLFGIFFWDVLFMPVADVFQNPYQNAPLDLETESFFQTRLEHINQRLSEIYTYDSEDIFREVMNIFDKHSLEECRGLNWNILGSVETLAKAASCIPAGVLSGCLEKIARNYKYWIGGQPDLFLWRSEPVHQVKFVEVKGPADKLSERQRLWLYSLLEFGGDAVVAKVKPS
eukprot:jgi/Galph1/736/GphlegSOOS_G5528.1